MFFLFYLIVAHIHFTLELCSLSSLTSCMYLLGGSSYYDMTSFSEIKAEKTCTKKDNKGKQFLNFNMLQLSRIYPKGKSSQLKHALTFDMRSQEFKQ